MLAIDTASQLTTRELMTHERRGLSTFGFVKFMSFIYATLELACEFITKMSQFI